MNLVWNARRAGILVATCAFVVAAGCATPALPRPDEGELLAAGFKVLVAVNRMQEDWVRSLPPGQIRPMQRNDKKYFVYPDAPKKQIYVGGPQQYEAYQQLLPEKQRGAQEAVSAARQAANRASYNKQDDAMRKATARDLSDPWLGVGWADLGW
ncbi:MAG: hypothetical protein ABI724_17005 [Betaproteobacteria bacterium]